MAAVVAVFVARGTLTAQTDSPPATGAVSPSPGTKNSPDVTRLLAGADSVYGKLSSLAAAFEQTIEIPLLARRRTGTGTWYQKGRGRFKMEFSVPKGDVIVADGTHLWLYYPSTHPGQVIRSGIEANPTGRGMVDLQGRILREARDHYDAVLIGSEPVHGHRTLQVRLTPRATSPYRLVQVWIDAATLLVRKFEITENNETLRTVTLWDLRPNARIPDSVFKFAPPPGTDVFEG